jgi:hypothetical protein
MMVAFNPNVGEVTNEILGWSTTPNASGQLVPAAQLSSDKLSKGVAGYPTPGRLSTPAQLSQGGTPVIMSPQGLALDVSGGVRYLAVQGGDPTGQASSGIIQICASSSCGTAKRGSVSRDWSAIALSGLANDVGDAFFAPAGISTAADGSLTVLLDEQTGPAPSNIDVVKVPASLSGKPAILSSPANAVTNADFASLATDDAAVFTEDAPIEAADPDGATAATLLAAPQIVSLSNGLYAGEFEPDPTGQPDPQNPSGNPGLWTNHNPGVRLLAPRGDGTLSSRRLP